MRMPQKHIIQMINVNNSGTNVGLIQRAVCISQHLVVYIKVHRKLVNNILKNVGMSVLL